MTLRTPGLVHSTGIGLARARGQYPGVNSNTLAKAGNIGEYFSASRLSGAALSLANGAGKSIASVPLTPGEWVIQGGVVLLPAGTTSSTLIACCISTTADTSVPDSEAEGVFVQTYAAVVGGYFHVSTGSLIVSVPTPTTYYINGQLNFTISTATAYGAMSARRLH